MGHHSVVLPAPVLSQTHSRELLPHGRVERAMMNYFSYVDMTRLENHELTSFFQPAHCLTF